MTNREKLIEEIAQLPNDELFVLCTAISKVDRFLCEDCKAAGRDCPEDDCGYEDEWMAQPCKRDRLLIRYDERRAQ